MRKTLMRWYLIWVIGLIHFGIGSLSSQVLQSFDNYGTITQVTNLPQIVVNFTNRGYIDIVLPPPETTLNSPATPFEFFELKVLHTRAGTFPGSGLMVCEPGWSIGYRSRITGTRGLASLIQLDNGSALIARSPALASDGSRLLPCSMSSLGQSFISLRATNIVVKAGINGGDSTTSGSVIAGANGLIELSGAYVNLDRAGIHILPIWLETVIPSIWYDQNGNPVSFDPDVGIQDEYWESDVYTQQFPLNTAGLWNGTTARTGPTRTSPGFMLDMPYADSYIYPVDIMPVTVTNFVGTPDNASQWYTTVLFIPTNLIKGAVFVSVPADFNVDLGFGALTQLGREIHVVLSTQVTNVVSQMNDWAYITIIDTLGADTNRAIIPNNFGCGIVTYRPANYWLLRYDSYGMPGNWGYPEPEFFISSGVGLIFPEYVAIDTVTNALVQSGDYTGYGAFCDNLVFRPIPTPEVNFSNLPGRVVINATNLSLNQTRIRAEGYVKVQAANLLSSRLTIIDCENIGLDLNSTNGNIVVQSLVPPSVERLRGHIYLWSAVWSNTALAIITNNWVPVTNVVESDGVTNIQVGASNVIITNTIGMRLHTLMVDATGLQKSFPVNVHELVGRATNVTIYDNMRVLQNLQLLGRSLTVYGSLEIPGVLPMINEARISVWPGPQPLSDFTWSNAPNLVYFTNYGRISIYNNAHFGDDGPRRYEYFHNVGVIEAASLHVNSATLFNGGILNTIAYQRLESDFADLRNGQSLAGSDITLAGKSFKLDGYTIRAGGMLELAVTNFLSDSGSAADNAIFVTDGFRMVTKPAQGDLLGTRLVSIAPALWAVDVYHTWAGRDLGPIVAGYSNNAAVGVLSLDARSPYPLFEFGPASGRNALYVEELDISSLGADFTNKMWINENFVIYYASARIGFTPPPHPNGEPQTPEEYLDGQFEGRLRWVRDFAGTRSGVPIVVDGRTILVNRALRESRVIDTDGDGIPNYYDSTPFGGLSLIAELTTRTNAITIQKLPDINANVLALKWFARSNTVYRIEYSTNLSEGTWLPLTTVTNTASTNKWLTVTDESALRHHSSAFYRLVGIKE